MQFADYLAYQGVLARRAWAAILDYLLFLVILSVYISVFGEWVGNFTYYIHGLRHVLGVIILWFLYFPVVESIWGYTLFKGLFNLRVVPDRKGDFPLWNSLKRHLLDPVDFVILGLVAILLSTLRSDHKRLGDIVARSHVVRE